jgi:hypothetical protein
MNRGGKKLRKEGRDEARRQEKGIIAERKEIKLEEENRGRKKVTREDKSEELRREGMNERGAERRNNKRRELE